jgi:hypothetical protein
MRIVLVSMILLLSGCASGTILRTEQVPPAGASHISASAGVVQRIAPLHSVEQGISVDRASAASIWVSKGWYNVEFYCNDLVRNGEIVAVSTQSFTNRNIRVRAGHKYRLVCDPDTLGVLHLEDIGVAPNNSFKPKPLRGSA